MSLTDAEENGSIRTTGTLTMFNELNWNLFFIKAYMKIYIRDWREQL